MESRETSTGLVSWSLRELFAQAGVTPTFPKIIPARIVSALRDDSRKVTHGDCFVAVRGAGVDGHKFVDAAAAAGAVAVVTEKSVRLPEKVAGIEVRDTREAMAKLAAAYYGLRGGQEAKMRFIGVTGTNGKTTIAFLLRSIVQRAGEKPAMLGTIEYDLVGEKRAAPLTTPGSLALCELLSTARAHGATWAAMEISSHALDQRRCEGLCFDAAIFTNLTGDHLDYHHSMEAYARAKMRLFEGLNPSAKAVVNLDDAMGELFAGSSPVPVTSYGMESPKIDVYAQITSIDRFGTRFLLRTPSFQAPINFALIGKHNVMNALASSAAMWALGIDADFIVAGLESLKGVPGRLQRVEPNGWPYSVIVDYAHTDDALRNVLNAVRPMTRGRLVCVFGCGGDRDRTKRSRMARVVAELADVAFVTSDNPRSEDPRQIIDEILTGFEKGGDRLRHCRVETEVDRQTAIEAAIQSARPGDTVLIAGKGHENYQLVGDRVLHFDDVEVARNCMDAVQVSTAMQEVSA